MMHTTRLRSRPRAVVAVTAVAAAAAFAGALTLAGGAGSPARAQQQTPGAAAAQTAPALTGTWKIDPAHSNINFAIKHMGLSTVRGRFDEFSGTIVADAANPAKSSVEVTIRTDSIDTDVKMRDDHLKTADFLDTAKYPTITFKSTRVEKAASGGGFVAHGDLTMHGVTKQVSLPFTVAGPIADPQAGGARFGAETEVRLNRQDFGISNAMKLPNGALAIANEVDITIGLEAVPAKPEAASAAAQP
mgnify:CR=1 FL=1|jgi:Uncharacterized conserved protein